MRNASIVIRGTGVARGKQVRGVSNRSSVCWQASGRSGREERGSKHTTTAEGLLKQRDGGQVSSAILHMVHGPTASFVPIHHPVNATWQRTRLIRGFFMILQLEPVLAQA